MQNSIHDAEFNSHFTIHNSQFTIQFTIHYALCIMNYEL